MSATRGQPMTTSTEQRPQSQDDRCSLQHHLWRRNRHGEMTCRCGAAHPLDLDQYLARLSAEAPS